MARARTLTELLTEVRALTDAVGDDHITDAQATVWINQGIAELWRKLVEVSPDRYAILSSPLSTTAGTAGYSVASDFMSVMRVERLDGTTRIPIDPFNFIQAPRDNPNPRGGGLTRYRIVGGGAAGTTTQIYFDPDPGTNTYQYWYVQAPPVLVGGNSFNGIAGYEDWVVLYTALRIYIRQQDPDQASIAQEMMRIESSIKTSASRQDVGRAPRIADVRRRGRR